MSPPASTTPTIAPSSPRTTTTTTPSAQPTVRLALASDIPSILSLVLTSYRQFPLFHHIYSPLTHDISTAHDTVFFWRRRIFLYLLQPAVTVLVAEVAAAAALTAPKSAASGEVGCVDSVEGESWRMLEWVRREGLEEREGEVEAEVERRKGKKGRKKVVGFAVWKDRVGCHEDASVLPKADWISSLRSKFNSVNFWTNPSLLHFFFSTLRSFIFS